MLGREVSVAEVESAKESLDGKVGEETIVREERTDCAKPLKPLHRTSF